MFRNIKLALENDIDKSKSVAERVAKSGYNPQN